MSKSWATLKRELQEQRLKFLEERNRRLLECVIERGRMIRALAERVADQSELLSRRAERAEPG